jgi:2-polyprenyl-3-methyl-5-hydroxy-6-metoxy-1,4-benzoquinol methylase
MPDGTRPNDPDRASYYGLVRREIAPLVPKGTGALLDVGGGYGGTAVWLKAGGHAGRVGTIDLIQPQALHPELDFFRAGDVERGDFLERVLAEEGPFDTILCLDVLEHLADPWAVIAKLHKGLAPGGVIVASIPNIRFYQASLPLLFRGKWDLADAGILDRTHLRWFVKETAIGLMTSSGLRLEEVTEKLAGSRRVRLYNAATLGLLKGLFVLQYLIRVRAPS